MAMTATMTTTTTTTAVTAAIARKKEKNQFQLNYLTNAYASARVSSLVHADHRQPASCVYLFVATAVHVD